MKVKSLSRVLLFATPWTVAYQVPRSMGFSRQEYWSGLPVPSPTKVLLKVSGVTDQWNVVITDFHCLTSRNSLKLYISLILSVNFENWIKMYFFLFMIRANICYVLDIILSMYLCVCICKVKSLYIYIIYIYK